MSEIQIKESIVAGKAYLFALEIVNIYKYLITDKKEFVLSKQLLRSGTSIGANLHEAASSESKKDFVHKLSIGLKEAKETAYWLRLLKDSEYISLERYSSVEEKNSELIRMLSSSILTTKERYLSNNS